VTDPKLAAKLEALKLEKEDMVAAEESAEAWPVPIPSGG